MPTTPKEQLLVGVHQLEKAVLRVSDIEALNQLESELETLLEAARRDLTDEELQTAYADLNRLAQRITALIPSR